MGGERMVLDAAHGTGQTPDGGHGRRRGGVAAAGRHAQAHRHGAFFCNTDHGNRLFDAGEYIFDNGAAFVEYEVKPEVLFFEPADDGGGTVPVDFLRAGKAEVQVLGGGIPLSDQIVRSFQNTQECAFGINGAASPEDAVFNDALKSGLVPAAFIDWNNVEVGHEDARFVMLCALPVEDKGTGPGHGEGADLMHMGEESGE